MGLLVSAAPDACFSSMPVLDVGALLRINSRFPDVPNSLVAGKNAGNFADSAVFTKVCL
jgi:hypothetical protein